MTADPKAESCGVTFAGAMPGPHFYSWMKPCVLPAGHDSEVHVDADGSAWTKSLAQIERGDDR